MSHPQYYQNNLTTIPIDPDHLRSALKDLRVAVHRGADLVQHGVPPPSEWGITGVYVGVPGVALAFLRLARQADALTDEDITISLDFHQLAGERILPRGPDVPVRADRLSPSGSPTPLAGAVPRIFDAIATGSAIATDDVHVLQHAVETALKTGNMVLHHDRLMGADDALYGRAGLLWTLLNLRAHETDEKTSVSLKPIFEPIPLLIDKIVDAGRKGHRSYIQKHGTQNALPLMWPWHEAHYGLGAVHGMSGILAVLLACRPEELNDGSSRNYLPWIAETITVLSQICIKNNGHLPTTIPPRHSSSHRESPLVQICHGSPGILLLLACAMRNTAFITDYWAPEWDEALRLAGDRTWEEGILPKGGGLCHGINGNAWPLLYAHDALEYNAEAIEIGRQNYLKHAGTSKIQGRTVDLTSDRFLSRALAMMLHGRETPPYKDSTDVYRLADRPFSLTEGLSGTVCAWAETCVVIQARLRKMELEQQGLGAEALRNDPIFQEMEDLKLGFPTIAYYRPSGHF
ncbi:lanthionine synthetase C family protein [Aspergillus ambiguus]|uniref:lanthionine synthetase C family protein n=1 Tax=Aspergillus ambiguus TaxID=176160 RepID=UPI003CCCDF19